MSTPAVIFNYANWIIRYPEFVLVLEPLAQAYFDDAGTNIGNEACNPAFGVTVYAGSTPIPLLSRLLDMVTAHIAWLNAPRDASGNPSSTGTQPAPAIVGRISSATVGSVSVSSEFSASGGPSEAWFLQTKYGAAYWTATAQFRTMRYSPRPTIVADGVFPYAPSFLGGRRIY